MHQLSSTQQQILLTQSIHKSAVLYNVGGYAHISGNVIDRLFIQSIELVLQQADVLGPALQALRHLYDHTDAARDYVIDVKNFSGSSTPDRDCVAWMEEDIAQGFSNGCFISISLLKAGETSTYWYVKAHHLVFDGFSMSLFFNEVNAVYARLATNDLAAVTPNLHPFAHFVETEQQYLSSDASSKDRHFWVEQFKDHADTRAFLSCMEGGNPAIFSSRKKEISIPRGLVDQIEAFCNHRNINVLAYFIAQVLLLNRLYNNNDAVLGVPFFNRRGREARKSLGPFVNAIPFSTRIDLTNTFSQFLLKVHTQLRTAYRHSSFPLINTVKELNLQSTIYNIIFSYQRNSYQTNSNDGLEANICYLPAREQQEDLAFQLLEYGDTKDLTLVLSYKENLFAEKTIDRLLQHFYNLLNFSLLHAEESLDTFSCLTAAEQEFLTGGLNNTAKGFPSEKTIATLFEEQVLQTPDSIALTFDSTSFSYHALNRTANQFAAFLQQHFNIRKDDVVLVGLERGEQLVISLLSILKLGGAYVSVDPEYPETRIHHIYQESGATGIISAALWSDFLQQQTAYTDSNPSVARSATDNFCIIYTSGSTGLPKGCVLTNRGVVNNMFSKIDLLRLQEGVAICHNAETYFVGSLWQLWAPLICGGEVVLCNYEEMRDLSKLFRKAQQYNCKILTLIPSQLQEYLVEVGAVPMDTISTLILTGEKLSAPLIDRCYSLNPAMRVVNTYGQTESTDDVTFYVIPDSRTARSIPVGNATQNMRMYVLSSMGTPCAINVLGEVYTSGAGVANGYVNNALLTKEKFIPDPFRPDQMMYRTGDLGRWLEEGIIEVVGRVDEQVKVRGYRVELAEIRKALLAHSHIDDVVLLHREMDTQEKHIIAYMICRESIDLKTLRDFLLQSMPYYMLPAYFIRVGKFPLLANGKVDKRGLFEAGGLLINVTTDYIRPRNETERKLANIWQAVLKRPNIGVEDNFFELGGHSLSAMTIINLLKSTFHVTIHVRDVFECPTIASLAAVVHQARHTGDYPILQPIPATLHNGYDLSSPQYRMWMLCQDEESNRAYNMSTAVDLQGPIDLLLLERSFSMLIERHEILSTFFREDGSGTVLQFIDPSLATTFRIHYTDLRATTDAQQYLNDLLLKDFQTPFNLDRSPLIRVSLFHTGDRSYTLSLIIHHIISDGWSMRVLVNDLLTIYRSGGAHELPELYIQYKDFADWQKKLLNTEQLEGQREFWLQQLAGELPQLQLPQDNTRPKLKSYQGKTIVKRLQRRITDGLKELCLKEHTTLFTGLMAAVNTLLHRYTAQSDIIIGSAVSAREDTVLEYQLGLYVNTIAIRTMVAEDDSFTTLLSKVHNTILESFKHQLYPFDEVVRALGVRPDTGRNPIFDVMVVLQNTGSYESFNDSLEDIQLSAHEVIETCTSKFDLSFEFIEFGPEVELRLEYSTDIFEQYFIVQLVNHLERIIDRAVSLSQTPVRLLQYLEDNETNTVLKSFNETAKAYPSTATVAHLFTAQALLTPDATAVVFNDSSLSYRQLDQKSNQLAHYLLHHGIGPGSLVPVCMERSPEMITGIIAILKAGAAYVPIDISYPTERIRFILEDTSARIVLTDRLIQDLPEDIVAVNLLQEATMLTQLPTEQVAHQGNSHELCYVIYTSGTTGRPKGVLVEHGNVVSLIRGGLDTLDFKQNNILLSTGSVSFDATTFEYWSMLLTGGALVLCPPEDILKPTALKRIIRQHSVKIMWLTAGLLNQLTDNDPDLFEGLKVVVAGGEKLSPGHIGILKKRFSHLRLFNGYGPTENTTFSLTYEIKELKGPSIPIGKPLGNRTAYILEEAGIPCAIGIPGELYVGGAGVARGYLNLPELTAEKFIHHPFSNDNNKRLYKTGDRARWLPDGNIEFLGRRDDQVKIRGYRIEPGEVEAALQACHGVQQCVVVAEPDHSGSGRLVGYVVGLADYDHSTVLDQLRSKLPAYMIPTILMQLDNLPLTANGKVNKGALPKPDASHMKAGSVAPGTELEKQLATIWAELLQIEFIGIEDNFFSFGGHSLLATRALSIIRQRLGMEAGVKDLFLYPTIRELAQHLSTQIAGTVLPRITAIAKQPGDLLPVSFSQERLWFIDRLQGSVQYHMSAIIRLSGPLQVEVLEQSLCAIINRHEVLSTVLMEQDGICYQQIRRGDQWKLSQVSFINNDEAISRQHIAAYIDRPFNLSADYMVRAELLELSQDDHLLVVVIHHIASDGWSLPILIKELSTLYSAGLSGEIANLPELEVQYSDYAIWQRTYLEGPVLDRQLQYWKGKLQGIQPIDLPLDHIRPAVQSGKGSSIYIVVDKELTSALKELCREEGTTLFMVLLSVFKVLLYRYSGSEDIAVGTPIANRRQQEIESLAGFFVNTLVIRSELRGTLSFRELLRQVKATLLEAYENQDAPFERVVEVARAERDLSRSPLFQVMFALQNTPNIPELQLGELTLHPENNYHNTAKFDINVMAVERDEQLYFEFEYSTDLFDRVGIERLGAHYEQLLRNAVANRDEKINALSLLKTAERQQIVKDFNNTLSAYSATATVADLFEEQATLTPDITAVSFNGIELSYRELEEKSNQLAHYLQSKGIGSGALVPVCLDRSTDLIVCIVGILKSGAAYVPIELSYPVERMRFILADTNAQLIVTDGSVQDLPEHIEVINVLRDRQYIAGEPKHRVVSNATAASLCYVIYTSGTTGRPKGVRMPHTALVNLLQWQRKQLISSDIRILQFASINFDVSFQEIFTALCSGAALELISDDDRKDFATLVTKINEAAVTHLFVPYVVLQGVAEYCSETGYYPKALSTIITAGEQLKLTHDIRLLTDTTGAILINQYGPTEAHVVSSYNVQPEDYLQRPLPPIGQPISNTQLYILDEQQQPCPLGVTGELYIGGACVATGYQNLPELTAEKFISHPFDNQDSEKLYKTGDIARWLPDGNIEFLGRRDDQVKIRGYRIELGEVESALQSCQGVGQCVVIAVADNSTGSKRLIGYVVPAETYTRPGVLQELRNKLPEYMIPAVLVEINSIPLTSNGKVDKRALPKPDASMMQVSYVAPRTELEKQLTEIWSELLKVERIGIEDNFFELGGHSLLATRVTSLIRSRIGAETGVKDLFLYPTIKSLAGYLVAKAPLSVLPRIVAATKQPSDLLPVSFSQERLWFIDGLQGSVQYHMPVVMRLKGHVRVDVLEQCLRAIIARHEVLRTVLIEQEGVCYQQIRSEAAWALPLLSFADRNEEGLKEYITQSILQPFDLSTDYMVRAELLELSREEYILVVVMHHISSDGWSLAVLVKELVELYSAGVSGSTPNLPGLEVQYSDYAIWQRTHLEGAVLEQQLQYWKNKLAGIQPIDLPLDHVRPAVQSGKGASLVKTLDKTLIKALKELSTQEGATLYMVLLSVFKILLYRYSGSTDLAVGTPIANRRRQEIESLVGFFVNTLVVRSELKGDLSFRELLKQVKATLLEAYEYQDAPFERVVEVTDAQRDLSLSPLFQVLFALQNTPDIPALQLTDLDLLIETHDNNTAKFDLSIDLRETNEGIIMSIEYATDLFDRASIERMGQHYEQLLKSVVNNYDQKIISLTLLNDDEKRQVVTTFNNTAVAYPATATVTDLFEVQAALTPNAIAVAFNDHSITYQELEEKGNQLAHHLQAKGIGAGSLVPVCMDRSIAMITGIVGILKSGAAYVPIDINYPAERMEFILADIHAHLIVTDRNIQDLPEAIEPINITGEGEAIADKPKYRTTNKATVADLCYVIYTSGTTGRPKGVRMPHAALVNLLQWQKRELTSSDIRILQFASINFDVSFQEIFTALCTGSTLELISDDDRKDFSKLVEKINQTAVTHLFVPYVVLQGVAEYCHETGYYPQTLKEVITAGEQLKLTNDVKALVDHTGAVLINQYGPTEAHVVTSYKVQPEDYHHRPLPPIGQPISNVQMYILDEGLQPCPLGITGELYIGGICVAAGYQLLPALTTEKFIPDSFSKQPGARLYKTGDRARWLVDGNIEFLGRRDDQVKIRGYRIEPGEVESALQSCDGVGQCVVIADTGDAGNRRLVGYVVPLAGYDQSTVLNQLRSRLPEYMVPAVLMEIDSIPLTSNGKTDKRSLPKPVASKAKAISYVAPRTEPEKQLSAIWAELLKIERIGIHDNFFELGGHSLLATRVLSLIRRRLNIEAGVKDLFLYPTIEAMARFLNEKAPVAVLPQVLPTVKQPGQLLPVSFSQERLWFIDRLQGSVQYHMPAVIRLKGNLHVNMLEHSLRSIIQRHEVLRTVLIEQEGVCFQQINSEKQWQLSRTSIAGNDEDAISQYIAQCISRPFDLSADYMFRAELIELSASEYILVVLMHHIASDGWSLPILIKELSALYSAALAGETPELPGLEVQYSDYAIWQRTYLEGVVLEKQLSYWKKKLEGIQPPDLPLDYPRPAVQSGRGASLVKVFDKELVKALRDLSTQEGVTLYMVLLSAFKVLLYRYSGSEDIAVGTPIANRRQQEIESLVGFFVNTIVIRSELKGELSFKQLLQQLKNTLLEAYEQQDAPFEKVVDVVGGERDLSRSPLFQVMFALQNTPHIPDLQLKDVTLLLEEHKNDTAKFDLNFDLREINDHLHLTVEYATDLFEQSRIKRMLLHYEELLRCILIDLNKPVSGISLLDNQEKELLLHGFNDTAIAYELDQTVADLFQEQFHKTPDSIAVIDGDQQFSYRQLNEESNQLAHYLRAKGIGSNSLVPVCMDRSIAMVVGIVGILKSGAAYVPIDISYPIERIHFILADTDARLIVGDGSVQDLPTGIEVINLLKDQHTLAQYPKEQFIHKGNSDDLCYLIYTSGTTGKPKGVKMHHRAMVNLLLWHDGLLNDTSTKRVLQFASINFDASFQEIFSVLCFGGSIVLIGEMERKDMHQLLSVVQQYEVNHLFIPFVVLQAVSEQAIQDISSEGSLKSLTHIFTAGEQLRMSAEIIALCRLTGLALYNYYGPSETHVVTAYKVQVADCKQQPLPPIGSPISNTQIYLLDKYGSLCPIGIAGELFIGGDSVAQGYLNRPELTQERFLKDWFSKDDNAFLYRTGDIARWLPDGNIEFLGRRDDQVKIRGYRIELGEVESALQSCQGVGQCVVIAVADNSTGSKRLIGYMAPDGAYARPSVLQELRNKLPEYMIPAMLVEIDSIPLTSNGKVDKRALPRPDTSVMKVSYVAPRTEREKQLTEIWSELLRVERIGIEDNFFELGGHSLLATRVLSVIRRRLNIEAGVKDLFLYPTIETLARHLSTQTSKSVLPKVAGVVKQPGDLLPLSFSQERLWFIDRLQGSTQYHMPAVLRLKGKVQVGVLEQSLRAIIARHEVLRTVLIEQEGICYQQIKDEKGWSLSLVSFTDNDDAAIKLYIAQSTSQPFDLSADFMLRAALLELSKEEYILVVTMHHIASDGWSLAVLVKELVELYDAGIEGRQSILPPLEVQYSDYAIWQRTHLEGAILDQQLQYWKNKLAGIQPIDLPLDHARPAVQSGKGSCLVKTLDKTLIKALKELSTQEGATLYMVLLSVFKILLYRYSGSEDIVVGTPIANRRQQEIESLVGFFVNTLVVRSELKDDLSFRELLRQIKITLLEAYEHQDAPFERVVEVAGVERDLSRSPLFQVMFAFQNTPDIPTLQLTDLDLLIETYDNNTAKFDLSIDLREVNEGILMSIEYATDLFDRASIERMGHHYEQLLKSILNNHDQKIISLTLLNDAEKQQVVTTFNNTAVEYPAIATVTDLFEAQATLTPDAIAVAFNDHSITYRELEEKSNQIAHHLQAKGIGAGSLIPVCMDRSIAMITGIVGILKSGAAYVPIDINYPAERIQFILHDTGAGVVVTDGNIKELPEGIEPINISGELNTIAGESTNRVTSTVTTNDICYIIYTSGTTGKPKGVKMPHVALVNLLQWQKRELASSNMRILQFASINFDVSFQEIFTALCTGSTLELISDDDRKDFAKLVEKINQTAVTHLLVPYVVLQGVAEYCHEAGYYPQTIKEIITAGEQLKLTHEIRLLMDTTGAALINQYGPTEAHVVTSYKVQPEDYQHRPLPPIGQPISNAQMYILDKVLQPCPVGIMGELYIGGTCVATGYQNLPGLTAEKFVSDGFNENPEARLYKTGDRARWLADGNIEFLGRRDDQVKIRGYRIELGEVESALQSFDGIGQCVVIADTGDAGNRRLVGYVVSLAGYDQSTVLKQLRSRLPDYMVPAVLLEIDSIPLTPNGKVDKRSLPKPAASKAKIISYVAPRSELEKQLTEIWRELLKVERVGIEDNFFELGGHSLLATRVTSLIRNRIGVETGVKELFQHSTVASLAKHIQANNVEAEHEEYTIVRI
jgi:amino acid adenylation domain-containing protein